jgi:acyl-CoA thioester hydrolase
MRWADLDMLEHVNNVTYVDYMQEARVDMFRAHPPAAGDEKLAEGVVVVRNEVQFLKPIRFRTAPIRIELWVTEVRAATFSLAYEILDVDGAERTVYAAAKTVLVPYVFEREAPRRLSPHERATLEMLRDEEVS